MLTFKFIQPMWFPFWRRWGLSEYEIIVLVIISLVLLAGTVRFWCSGYTAGSTFQLTFDTPPQKYLTFPWHRTPSSVKKCSEAKKASLLITLFCTVSTLGILSVLRNSASLRDVIFYLAVVEFTTGVWMLTNIAWEVLEKFIMKVLGIDRHWDSQYHH